MRRLAIGAASAAAAAGSKQLSKLNTYDMHGQHSPRQTELPTKLKCISCVQRHAPQTADPSADLG